MMALWMIYATVISAALGVAAALVDRTAGPIMHHRRWIWVAAVVLSAAFPVTGALVAHTRTAATNAQLVRSGARHDTGAAAESSVLATRIAALLATADSRTLGRLDKPLAIAWGIAAGLALVAYAVGTWSLARRRRTWQSTFVDGERVLIAPAVGPAVVGAMRPAIVVPQWSLQLAPEQRALMIEHERQHVRARDPLVLHAGAIIAMMTPWNLAMWWLYRRLRLAVELDCDARVLASSRDVRAYGTLLLDVCSRRRRPSAVLAPALLERRSSLTRRILAMHPRPVRYARPRAALGAAVALGIVVLACDMPTPEMLAPDGASTPTERVSGKAGSSLPLDGIENIKKVVALYFPAIARGDGEPAAVFVVRSSTGEILLAETQPASALARRRASRTGDGSAPRTRADKSQNARAALPVALRSIEPNEIGGIEVSKHAGGVVAPKPVSLIVITLKPGATFPMQRAAQ